MKRFILFITFLVFSFIAFAQVNGSFNYGQDGHVYFYLVNNTRFHVPVTVIARNAQKNQSRRDQVTVWSGNTFFFGPNYNWAWEKGETMTVIDGNGQSANWVCPYTDPDVINMNGGYSSNNNGYKTCQQCGERYSGYHTCKSKVGSQSSGNSYNKSNNSVDIKVTFKNEVAIFKFQKKGNYLYSYKDGKEISHTEITEYTLTEWKDAYNILIDEELNVNLIVNKENCTWNNSGRISREDLKKFDILHKILYGK